VAERFYSGQREGEIAVREVDGRRRSLHNRFDYRKYVSEQAEQSSSHARLAFNFLRMRSATSVAPVKSTSISCGASCRFCLRVLRLAGAGSWPMSISSTRKAAPK